MPAANNCKLHCGVRAVRCLRSFLDRHVLPDTDPRWRKFIICASAFG